MKIAKYHGYIENPKYNSIDGKIDAELRRKRHKSMLHNLCKYVDYERRKGTLKWKP